MLTLSDHLAEGFSGGPSYETSVIPLAGGKERRNKTWPLPKRVYRFGFPNQDIADCWAIEDFFHDVNGRGDTWLMPDFTVAVKTHNIGTGNGVTTAFQARVGYGSGSIRYVPCYGIKPGTLTAYVNSSVTVPASEVDGLITFSSPPANGHAVTTTFVPLIKVRFDTDECFTEPYGPNGRYGRIANLSAIEVL